MDFLNKQTCCLSMPAVWKKKSREKIIMHSLRHHIYDLGLIWSYQTYYIKNWRL